ncbi:MAG: methionine gamma-lyase family protein [Clostridia bacterium]|nr:methionine gamma-lyase family protein [Clostridia bacterium]
MERAMRIIKEAERNARLEFERIDELMAGNQERVLRAFRNRGISVRHFSPSNGYGYDDIARDALDGAFADAMQSEDALVRPQIVNGSHAIFLALSGLSKPGFKILALTGEPYDTLRSAIGLEGDARHSLKQWGVDFLPVPLTAEGGFDYKTIEKSLTDTKVKIAYIQRSRGYSWRLALTIKQINECIEFVHSIRPDIRIIVDNCYGEFTELCEPTAVGADVIAGSLIKNPGGGLAPTGGYLAGKAACIDEIANRLTVPGMGREVGSYAASYQPFYQGLFFAPHVTGQCLKTAVLFSEVLTMLGYETLPKRGDQRSDIIQAVKLGSPEAMERFCLAIQQSAPIDSFAIPTASYMPGYADPVIMAAGAFIQGATTELSADGPMRPPYIVYMQGGLTYEHGRIAAAEAVLKLTHQP